MSPDISREQVVLVDDAGNAIGTMPKQSAHHADTPLHLAFSCYVFDATGRLLVTQRALHKPTWPGVWTNSVCGHPGPGEDIADAVQRRAVQELGLTLASLELVLPAFRYEATMANGVRENELCPVFTAVTADELLLDPAEVAAAEWVPWAEFRDEVLAGTREVSPWCVTQVEELTTRETDGEPRFATASRDQLPPAARP
jgi:isopentenyl-diphosphate Delta-isomerase